MVAVGTGARETVLAQIRSLGANLIVVIPGNVTVGGVRLGSGARASLTQDDALALEREIDAVEAAAPTSRGQVQAVAGGANWSSWLLGVTTSFFVARDWDVAAGRGFEAEEYDRGAQVVLLGETVARMLFDDADPVGETIRVRNVPFRVVGVLAPKGQTTGGQDQDDVIAAPLRAAQQRVLGVNRANSRAVGSITVRVREGEDASQVEEQVRALLRQRHRLAAAQEDDFLLRNLADIAATRDASSRTLSWLLAAIATVSLLVGGIGIMNIMLVSVTERTREIGLRLAVGARPRDVLMQFLIEAATLSALGGVAGAALGFAAARALTRIAGWPTLVSPEAILLAVGVSAGVGIVFGYYPARRAAALDPIEALRHA
jgi:putative ABC transport system permease protein